MRKTVRVFRIQSDLVEQPVDFLPAFLLGTAQVMDIQRFSHDFADCHPRVQACGRILEDDLHLPPVRKHGNLCLCFAVKNRFPVVDDPS